MKALLLKEEQFLTDANGKRVGVLVDLKTYERLREAEDRVLIDVSDKFRKLQQTRQALVVAQLAEETARETLRINTNQYKLTAALLSDVLQSQSTLAEANHQFQQALLGYWTAQAEFEKALGEDN